MKVFLPDPWTVCRAGWFHQQARSEAQSLGVREDHLPPVPPRGAALGIAKYICSWEAPSAHPCAAAAARILGSIDLLKVHVSKCISLWPCEQLGDRVRKSAVQMSLWVCQPLAAQAWPQASGELQFTVRAGRKALLCLELLLVVTLKFVKNWVVHRNQAFLHTHKFRALLYLVYVCALIEERRRFAWQHCAAER